MLYTDTNIVVTKMNECASTGTPFLFAFNFELDEAIFVPNPKEQNFILFDTPLGGNEKHTYSPKNNYIIECKHETFEEYEKRFDVVNRALKRGDSFLVNLTSRTEIKLNHSLNDIFHSAVAPYKLCLPNRFVCFSPERFVYISEDGTISTDPMKGTIDASVPDAKEIILNDKKESAEHATVVDLLRNDISKHASSVHVSKYRYTTLIKAHDKSILQVSSEIKGKLPEDWRRRVGDIILDMLPAGSISGAPKDSTVSTIKKAEKYERGFYTGVFGYFDGKRLDSGVLIRYIEKDKDGKHYFRSGGGITAMSDARSEYEEVKQKIYIPEMEQKFSEVICIIDGEPQHLSYHTDRMNRTTKHFFEKETELPDLKALVPEDARSGKVKCRIVYGREIESIDFSHYEAKERRSVATVHDDTIDYTYKSTNREPLSNLVKRAGTDDVIIIRKGMVTDASYCNVVFEDENGNMFTPEDALLKGTCRQRLLDKGIIKERKIRYEDIKNYKFVYFINAMMNIGECQKIDVLSIDTTQKNLTF